MPQALGVGRIDIDLDKAARREFIPESDLQPPAIMYRGPDGSKKWCVSTLCPRGKILAKCGSEFTRVQR